VGWLDPPAFRCAAPNSIRGTLLGGLAADPPVFHAIGGEGLIASMADQHWPTWIAAIRITPRRRPRIFSRWQEATALAANGHARSRRPALGRNFSATPAKWMDQFASAAKGANLILPICSRNPDLGEGRWSALAGRGGFAGAARFGARVNTPTAFPNRKGRSLPLPFAAARQLHLLVQSRQIGVVPLAEAARIADLDGHAQRRALTKPIWSRSLAKTHSRISRSLTPTSSNSTRLPRGPAFPSPAAVRYRECGRARAKADHRSRCGERSSQGAVPGKQAVSSAGGQVIHSLLL